MPLPVISNTVRCVVRGTCESGQRWINTVHVQKAAGPILAGDITAIHPILVRAWSGAAYGTGTSCLALCAAGVTCDDVVYTPLDGTSASTTITVAGVGAQTAGQSLPGEVSEVVTLRTLVRGRSYRGRVFLPPWYQAERTTNGVILASGIASTITQWLGVQTALVAAGYTLGVASYLHALFTSLSTVTMDNKFDVQRGRK